MVRARIKVGIRIFAAVKRHQPGVAYVGAAAKEVPEGLFLEAPRVAAVSGSLAAVPGLRRELASMGAGRDAALLDVGSGAGLPGVVFAICCPALRVTCVDTVAKKAAFIRQAALELMLPNLTGLRARVESVAQPFDIVCSRAFASLADFTAWSRPALKPGGVWMAMKGRHPADEIAALPNTVEVFHVEQLAVPGLSAERCIVWARRGAPDAAPLN